MFPWDPLADLYAMKPARLGLLSACLLWLTACGSLPPGLPNRVVSAEELAGIPPAATHGTAVGPVPREDEPISAAFLGGLPAAYRSTVVHSPALDAVADVMASIMSDREIGLAATSVRAMLMRAGEPGLFVHSLCMWARGANASSRLAEMLGQDARRLILRKVPYAYGVALRSEGVSRRSAAIVLVERALTMESVPRHLGLGQGFAVRGRFEVAVEAPRAHFDLSDGKIWSRAIHPDAEGRFEIMVPAAETAGLRWFEITTRRAREDPTVVSRWRNTALLLPIYVDTPEPTVIPASSMNPPPDPPDAVGMASALTDAINAERVRLGRAPLTLVPALSDFASSRLVALRDDPEGGALSNGTADIRALGIPFTGYEEHSAAQGVALRWADIIDGLLHKPSTRRWLLASSAHSLGVVAEKREKDLIAYHVVALRTRPKAAAKGPRPTAAASTPEVAAPPQR